MRGQIREPGKNGMKRQASPPGFTYVALLVAITIIGITLSAAGKYWQNVALRDREEELLFRGEQYRTAIERYVNSHPSRALPPSIDELLKDSRSPESKRHLRQRYKDPVSGEDFVEVRDQLSKRILAVHSPSEKEPLKQGNFPDAYREFQGKQRYNEWVFVFKNQPQVPVAPPPRPHQ